MAARADELASYRYAPVFMAAPLAIWTVSLVADVATHLVGEGSMALLDLSYRLLGVGLITAVALAIWSGIDLRAFRDDTNRADVALTHTALVLGSILLAILSLFWRDLVGFETQAAAGPAVLNLLAVALLGGAVSYSARMNHGRRATS